MTRNGIWVGVFLLGLLLLVLIGASSAHAKTYVVDDDGTPGVDCDYTNINAGITASKDGDTLLVKNGTYTLGTGITVLVDKRINLVGDGWEDTIIDGCGCIEAVTVTADMANVSGFSIIADSPTYPCVKLDAVSGVRVSGLNISNNPGGAVTFANADSCVLDNSSIGNNTLKAVFLGASDNCVIKDNDIWGNAAEGLSLENCNGNLIYHNNFVSNGQNAYDDRTNSWHHPSAGGNYWSDHTNVDGDGDGIADAGYNVPGGGGNKDDAAWVEPDRWSQPTKSPDIIVDKTGTPGVDCDYTSINPAISAASDGDYILVKNGTYYEAVVVNKRLDIVGESNAGVIIHCISGVDVVRITVNWVNMSGFTVRNSGSNLNYAGFKIDGASYTFITDNVVQSNYCGFRLEAGSGNNTIANNHIYSNVYGIWLEESVGNNISNNNISFHSEWGIYNSANCDNNTYDGNSLWDNQWCGFTIYFSNYTTISNNNIINCYSGIQIMSSLVPAITTIRGNWIYLNSQYGILISQANNIAIFENTVEGNNNGIRVQSSTGISVWHNNLLNNSQQASDFFDNEWSKSYAIGGNHWSHYTSPDNNSDGYVDNPYNIPDGPSIDYWPFVSRDGWNGPVHNLDNDTYHDTIQQAIDNASDGHTIEVSAGTYYENVVVDKRLTLIGTGTGATFVNGSQAGDVIFITSDWVNVTGFHVSWSATGSGGAGIELSDVQFCNVEWNNCTQNREGIYLDHSANNTVSNNTCSDNRAFTGNGIYSYYSDYNLFRNNNCSYNSDTGIDLQYSDHCIIDNNSVYGNFFGINVGYGYFNSILDNVCILNGGDGLAAGNGGYNLWSGNLINGSHHGIEPYEAENDTFCNNTIVGNNWGVFASDSFNNTFYHNNFLESHYSHVWDNGNNIWNLSLPEGGNHWDNWTSPDANGDGIVDDPFIVPDAGNMDELPWTTLDGWDNYTSQGPIHNLDNGTYHATIQQAVDNASDGHTIEVSAGTYYENVVVDKRLTLRGESQNATIIDGGENGDVIHVRSDWVNITDLTVTRAGSTSSPPDAGIEFNATRFGRVKNVSSSFQNEYGIVLDSSEYLIIDNCYLVSNGMCAIYVERTNYTTITNNTLINNSYYGISIESCRNLTITNNMMFNDGIWLSTWDWELEDYYFDTHIIDTSNTINGKPVYYYAHQTGLTVPAGAGQVILASCQDMVVSGQTCNDGDMGIILAYTNDSIVSNNTANYNQRGFTMIGSSRNLIENNTINSNEQRGMRINPQSNNNTIANNSVSHNGDIGLHMDYSHYNDVRGNLLWDNQMGIYATGCNFNNFTYNEIRGNDMVGLSLKSPSSNNFVYHNNFMNQGSSNHGESENSTNIWNLPYPAGGNYFDNWATPDTQSGPNQDQPGADGVVDSPFFITFGESQDYYPWTTPNGWENYTPANESFNATKPLKAGWNLISLPLDITTWQAYDLCAQIELRTTLEVLTITRMKNGMFDDYLYRDGSSHHRLDGTDGYMDFTSINDFLLKPGLGYFVYTAGGTIDDVWEVFGDVYVSSPIVNFKTGWNFVSTPYHTLSTHSADDVLAQINAQNGAGACTKVCNWTSGDTWESWDGTVGVDFLLDDADHPMDKNGKAWAIYVTKEGGWTPL